MTDKTLNKEKLIVWLRDAIEYETQKPEDLIDYAFVDECMSLLSELTEDKAKLSEEEKRKIANKIMQKNRQPVRKKTKKLLATLIAAAMILAGALTAFATSTEFRELLISVARMGKGAEVEANGFTYTVLGEGKYYSNVEEFLEKEKLGIMYPRKLPEGISIKEIINLDTDNSIIFILSDTSIYINIICKVDKYNGYMDTNERVVYNNIDFYLHTSKENNVIKYDAYAIDPERRYVYSIRTTSKELRDAIISNFY